ncbi:MAG: metallothionein [Candidatus Binatia bacterium]
MAEQNCAHSGCNCKVQEGKGILQEGQFFCSEHCATARPAGQGGNCGCGHPECGSKSG